MSPWWQVPADVYLDHRHRNWVVAEELRDVVFVPARGVVRVHPDRAEHIARALLGGGAVMALEEVFTPVARTAPGLARLPRPSGGCDARGPRQVTVTARSRWLDALGWLGIVAGALVFAVALALPLDDPALVVAVGLVMRGGRLILDVDC